MESFAIFLGTASVIILVNPLLYKVYNNFYLSVRNFSDYYYNYSESDRINILKNIDYLKELLKKYRINYNNLNFNNYTTTRHLNDYRIYLDKNIKSFRKIESFTNDLKPLIYSFILNKCNKSYTELYSCLYNIFGEHMIECTDYKISDLLNYKFIDDLLLKIGFSSALNDNDINDIITIVKHHSNDFVSNLIFSTLYLSNRYNNVINKDILKSVYRETDTDIITDTSTKTDTDIITDTSTDTSTDYDIITDTNKLDFYRYIFTEIVDYYFDIFYHE